MGGVAGLPATLQPLTHGYSAKQAVVASNGVYGLSPPIFLNCGIGTIIGGFFRMINLGFLWVIFFVAILVLVGLLKSHEFYNEIIDKKFPVPRSMRDVFDGRPPTLNELFKIFWLFLIAVNLVIIVVLVIFIYH